MKWKDLVGKRVLYRDTYSVYTFKEAVVMEVSPSGKYVKLEFDSGTIWKCADYISLVEVLDDKPAGRGSEDGEGEGREGDREGSSA